MSSTAPTPVVVDEKSDPLTPRRRDIGSPPSDDGDGATDKAYRWLKGLPTGALWIIVAIWTLPSLNLLINSFRTRDSQRASGWWRTIFAPESYTLENYQTVLSADANASLTDAFLNSAAVTLPATVIPIAIAAFAAYAFAWIDFKGRKVLFIATVSLLAVPLQVALIPMLQLYVGGAHLTLPFIEKTITLIPDFDLAGTTTAVWLTHTGFGLPFAIFLLHNYISGLPKELFESARIDGADHFTMFWRMVLPLSLPVLAAFGIFQFLWVWNDYLIANTMAGSNPDAIVMTIRIANLAGDFGRNEHLLPAAAFIQTVMPLIVFFGLQRYFVSGVLAGSVKG